MQDEPVQERQIDQFFSGPGARADEWRELVKAAKTWSVGSGDRNKFLAQLALIAVTEESTPALNPEGKIP
jgi:arginine decarboxylase